jgi:Ser/Thr protein kinase RdoA (MazF antagonist)
MQADLDEQLARMLTQWSSATRVEGKLEGGYRNRLWTVRIRGRRYVARLSPRPHSALDWEIQLLQYLRSADMAVPEVLTTRDGRSRVDGLVVFSWLEGHAPSSQHDWCLVADALARLHSLTRTWSQRPAFRSSLELLTEDQGGDVRLDLMPADVVQRVRLAWRALQGEPTSVIHGDPGAGNIRVQAGAVGFIDWDESRVDVSLLDLVGLSPDLTLPAEQSRLIQARRAAVAWEVANGWIAEPAYARRRLAELDTTLQP